MTLICFGICGIVKVLIGESWKSSMEIRKSLGGFQKEFRSNGELNSKVIDHNTGATNGLT
jgi:hypothetical protein